MFWYTLTAVEGVLLVLLSQPKVAVLKTVVAAATLTDKQNSATRHLNKNILMNVIRDF
jgi:hypothetical protein